MYKQVYHTRNVHAQFEDGPQYDPLLTAGTQSVSLPKLPQNDKKASSYGVGSYYIPADGRIIYGLMNKQALG